MSKGLILILSRSQSIVITVNEGFVGKARSCHLFSFSSKKILLKKIQYYLNFAMSVEECQILNLPSRIEFSTTIREDRPSIGVKLRARLKPSNISAILYLFLKVKKKESLEYYIQRLSEGLSIIPHYADM